MTTMTHIKIDGVTDSPTVAKVSAALKGVPGMGRFTAELHREGTATVAALTEDWIDVDGLRAAITEAGFPVSDITITQDALAKAMREQAPGRQAMRNFDPSDDYLAMRHSRTQITDSPGDALQTETQTQTQAPPQPQPQATPEPAACCGGDATQEATAPPQEATTPTSPDCTCGPACACGPDATTGKCDESCICREENGHCPCGDACDRH
jgi:hypothetical protein